MSIAAIITAMSEKLAGAELGKEIAQTVSGVETAFDKVFSETALGKLQDKFETSTWNQAFGGGFDTLDRSPEPIADSTVEIQNAMSQAGIYNPAVSFLKGGNPLMYSPLPVSTPQPAPVVEKSNPYLDAVDEAEKQGAKEQQTNEVGMLYEPPRLEDNGFLVG